VVRAAQPAPKLAEARAVARPTAKTQSARWGAKVGKITGGQRPSRRARGEEVELTGVVQHRGGGGSVGRGDV
jgi:hypothetical protein